MKTRSERIHALIERLAPTAAAQHAKDGTWPNTHPEPGKRYDEVGNPYLDEHQQPIPARHSGAPYVIETLTDNRRRLTIRGDDGDLLAGVGATLDEAIGKLEAKAGLPVGGDDDK